MFHFSVYWKIDLPNFYIPYKISHNSKPVFSVSTTYETNTNQTLNGNNVDMEKEALDLADTQYQYSALIDQMNNNYSMIRSAIIK